MLIGVHVIDGREGGSWCAGNHQNATLDNYVISGGSAHEQVKKTISSALGAWAVKQGRVLGMMCANSDVRWQESAGSLRSRGLLEAHNCSVGQEIPRCSLPCP